MPLGRSEPSVGNRAARLESLWQDTENADSRSRTDACCGRKKSPELGERLAEDVRLDNRSEGEYMWAGEVSSWVSG